MAITYDPTLPTQKDNVRFILRDGTVPVGGPYTGILEDSEIQTSLTNNGWNDGLASCAEALAGYWAQQPQSGSEKDSSRQWPNRADFYRKVAADARAGAYADPTAPIRNIVQVAGASVPDCTLSGIRRSLSPGCGSNNQVPVTFAPGCNPNPQCFWPNPYGE